jgi:exosome complex RNA-binding protein Rrp42 (RNase PH superfamily)
MTPWENGKRANHATKFRRFLWHQKKQKDMIKLHALCIREDRCWAIAKDSLSK